MYRRTIKWSVRALLFLILILIFSLIFAIPTKPKTLEVKPFSIDMEFPSATIEKPHVEAKEVAEDSVTEIEEVAEESQIPVETEFVSYYDYTEGELDLLARLIYSEGGGESYETKLGIGSVVMNRLEDSCFPDTIHEVIYQPSQFSVTVVQIDGITMIDRPADEESYRAAKEILDYGSIFPSTVQVFYANYCNESWVTSRAVYDIISNTVFAHIYGG